MIRSLKISLVLAAVSCSTAITAQQEIQNSFYMFNSSVLNPAYAGSRDALSVVMDYRNQWTGWDGAPQTGNFIAHTPLMNESIGVGINVLAEKIGPTTKSSAFADFAYRIKLNKKNDRLCFGLRSGLDMIRNNFSNLKINDGADPLQSANVNFNANTFNVGAGVYYYGKRHYIGVTAPKIIPSKFSDDPNFSNSRVVQHYYLIGGYVWKLNSLWDFKPSFAVKYTQNAPVSADVNVSFLFNNQIWFGAMYRHGAAAGLNVMYNVNKQVRIGYAYDYTLNYMGSYAPSTHEVIIGYDFITSLKALKSPRYF